MTYAWRVISIRGAGLPILPDRATRSSRRRAGSAARLHAAGSLRAALGEIARKQADIFLTCCTNALLARRDFPHLVSVAIAPELSVGAQYGLTVMRGAPEPAWRFAWFILSDDGQAILTRHGFGSLR